MSHFGKAGPPDIRDTYSLLVLNISFRTTADDLYPLFVKYGKVVDVFIPRDRRTGDSRGFAFVRYKYADEAHKAVERLDGRTVDGREIMVQFAKYGPNAERIQKGRIIESAPKDRSRSRSPRPRHREDRDNDYRRRSRSRSVDKYARDRYRGRERETRHRSRSASPYRSRDRRRSRYEDERRSRSRSASPYRARDRRRSGYEDEKRSRSRSNDIASPMRPSASPKRSPSPRKASPKGASPDVRKRSLTPKSVSPPEPLAASQSPSPRHSDAEE